MTNHKYLRWTGAAWIAALVVLSLQPLRPHRLITRPAGHFVLHILLFGSAAVVPLLLSRNRRQQAVRALCLFCLASAIEFCQALIYVKHMEWKDVEIDGFGILIAFTAMSLWSGPLAGGRNAAVQPEIHDHLPIDVPAMAEQKINNSRP